MNKKEYIENSKRMEALLKELTEKGKLKKSYQLELDEVSDLVQEYEEKYCAISKNDHYQTLACVDISGKLQGRGSGLQGIGTSLSWEIVKEDFSHDLTIIRFFS